MDLVVNLYELGESYVVFQVLHQSERVYSTLRNCSWRDDSTGWYVGVVSSPEVDTPNRAVFLRGDRGEEDLRVSRFLYEGGIELVRALLTNMAEEMSWEIEITGGGNPLEEYFFSEVG